MIEHDRDCVRTDRIGFEACGGCNRAKKRRMVAPLRALDDRVAWALEQPDVVHTGRTIAAVHYTVWVFGRIDVSRADVRRSVKRLGWRVESARHGTLPLGGGR